MNSFIKKGTTKKIIVTLVIVILFNFTVPLKAEASWGLGGSLLKEIMQLVAALGDVGMGALNNIMLGAPGISSAMLDKDDINLEDGSGSWLKDYSDISDDNTMTFTGEQIDTRLFEWFTAIAGAKYKVPNMLYSPESIFSNQIAALDVNFLTTVSDYQSIIVDGDDDKADQKAKPASQDLRETISSWYKAFRNIAVVGLLSVLIYLGIRILISATASDKAKYKESLRDWLVALSLVFVIHFIMAGILMITEQVTSFLSSSTTGYKVIMQEKTYKDEEEGEGETEEEDNSEETEEEEEEAEEEDEPVINTVTFRTNLTGLMRFRAQSTEWSEATAYTIIYFALVIYTYVFTFMYLKRFLYLAFLTMIAPLVSLTYPIDRAGDGKSQAFDMWFKEYTMNVIIQPVHLLLYTVLVTSANSLSQNPIYSLVAIGFLIPAEKFIKKMFGLDKASSTSGFGSFAGGAAVMQGINKLSSLSKSSGGKALGSGSNSDAEDSSKIHFQNANDAGNLNSYRNDEGNNQPHVGGRDLESEARQEEMARLRESLDSAENVDYNEPWLNPDSEYSQNLARYQQLEMEQREADERRRQEELERQRQEELERQSNQSVSTPRALGRTVIRGARGGINGIVRNKAKIARTINRGIGTVAGASIGLAAGIASGDASKAILYTAGGAAAGGAIGKNGTNAAISTAAGVGESAKQLGTNIRDAYNEEKYGVEEARRKSVEAANRSARKSFMRDPKEQRKYKDMASQLGYSGDLKDFMNTVADYKEADINDDKMIKNALKVEKANGGIGGGKHDNFVDAAKFMAKNNLGKDTFDDDSKFKSFENLVASTGLSESQQEQVKRNIAQMSDRKNLYDRRKNNRRS